MTAAQASKVSKVRVLEVKDESIVVSLQEGKYKLELLVDQPGLFESYKRVSGIIQSRIWNLDEVSKGGAYVEPVWGHPRRIQGRVVAIDEKENSILLYCSGATFNCILRDDKYKATNYELDQHIAVDPFEGAQFIPA